MVGVLASLAAVALLALVALAIRYHQTRTVLAQVQSLLELHMVVGTIPDKDLYDLALSRAVSMTHSEVGFFHVISDDQNEVILTTWNAAALTNCRIPDQRHYPIDQAGIWVDCVRTRAALVVNNYRRAAGVKGLPAGHFPLRRFMSVPVIDQDRVKIIFGVGNKRWPYRAADVQRLQLVATKLLHLIERLRLDRELQEAARQIQALSGLIPICAWCKKLRNDDGYWGSVESYLAEHVHATFTHGICPDCKKKALASDA